MFGFLKTKGGDERGDVKAMRHQLLQFLKEQLQRWEGEGTRIKGIQVFVAPAEGERELYEAVVYHHDEAQFRDEIQRIADDYAIGLPPDWALSVLFEEALPAETVKAGSLPIGLHLVTNKKPVINQPGEGKLTVLQGEAEREEYHFTSKEGKICIGREQRSQTAEGFFRINQVAFPANSSSDANKYISRQHAHIEWNAEAGCFFLFADEGGIPPRNKVKVRTATGNLVKLQTTQIGHPLASGDQIILGEGALLLFTAD